MPTAAVDDDDFQQILAQTREFVRTAVMPREQEILATDRVPDDLRNQAKDMGLFGYAIPQEWGGLGLDITQDIELAMELGYTSLALRSMFGTNNGIAGQVLVGFGTDEQKGTWLEALATGKVASFALTEPGAGSNPAGLRTKAIRDNGRETVHHQRPGRRPVRGLRADPPRRRRRAGHRGLPGPSRRSRGRGRRQGRQDGSRRGLDRRRALQRRPRSGQCTDRR
jgi:hypothetical protein